MIRELLDLAREDPHIKYNESLSRLDHKASRQTLWRFFREFNKRKELMLQRPELTEKYAQNDALGQIEFAVITLKMVKDFSSRRVNS